MINKIKNILIISMISFLTACASFYNTSEDEGKIINNQIFGRGISGIPVRNTADKPIEADILDILADQHNNNKLVTVATEQGRKYLTERFVGKLHFSRQRYSDSRAIATPYWHTDRVSGLQIESGWLLAGVDKNGLIDFAIWTHGSPKGKYGAEIAQGADVISTVIGLARGYSEANPLGLGGGLASKLINLGIKNYGPVKSCYDMYADLKQIGWAATGWNVAPSTPIGGALAIIAYIVSKPSTNETVWACMPDCAYKAAQKAVKLENAEK